jgi:hypothetical protein
MSEQLQPTGLVQRSLQTTTIELTKDNNNNDTTPTRVNSHQNLVQHQNLVPIGINISVADRDEIKCRHFKAIALAWEFTTSYICLPPELDTCHLPECIGSDTKSMVHVELKKLTYAKIQTRKLLIEA